MMSDEEEKVEFVPVYFVVKRKADKETLFFVPVFKDEYDVKDGGVFQLMSEIYTMERLSESQYKTFMALKVAPAFEPDEVAAIVVSDEDTKYYVSEKT